jgi:hypothetical protein
MHNRKVTINVQFEFYPEENNGFKEYYQSMSYDLLKSKVKEILDAQFLELPLSDGLWWHFEDAEECKHLRTRSLECYEHGRDCDEIICVDCGGTIEYREAEPTQTTPYFCEHSGVIMANLEGATICVQCGSEEL